MSRPWLFDAPSPSRPLSQEEEALVRIAGARVPRVVAPFFAACVDHRPSAVERESRALLAAAERLMDGAR